MQVWEVRLSVPDGQLTDDDADELDRLAEAIAENLRLSLRDDQDDGGTLSPFTFSVDIFDPSHPEQMPAEGECEFVESEHWYDSIQNLCGFCGGHWQMPDGSTL